MGGQEPSNLWAPKDCSHNQMCRIRRCCRISKFVSSSCLICCLLLMWVWQQYTRVVTRWFRVKVFSQQGSTTLCLQAIITGNYLQSKPSKFHRPIRGPDVHRIGCCSSKARWSCCYRVNWLLKPGGYLEADQIAVELQSGTFLSNYQLLITM